MLLICSAFDFTEQSVFTESKFSYFFCYFVVATCHCTKPRLNFQWYQRNTYNFGKFVFLSSPSQHSTILLARINAVTEVALWISPKNAGISTFYQSIYLKFLQSCSKNSIKGTSFYEDFCLLSDATLLQPQFLKRAKHISRFHISEKKSCYIFS